MEELTQEAKYHRELRAAMKRQDRKRREDPEADPQLDTIWVVYVWNERAKTPKWLLGGFAHARHLRLPNVRKIRATLRLKPSVVAKIVSLRHAQKHGPPIEPPHVYNPVVQRVWLDARIRGRA